MSFRMSFLLLLGSLLYQNFAYAEDATTTVRVAPNAYAEGTELSDFIMVSNDQDQKLKFEYCRPVADTYSTGAVCAQLGLRTYTVEEVERERTALLKLALIGLVYDTSALFGIPSAAAGTGAFVGLGLVKAVLARFGTSQLAGLVAGSSVGAAVGVTAEAIHFDELFVNPIAPAKDALAVDSEEHLREGVIRLPDGRTKDLVEALNKLLIMADYD